MRMSGIAGSAFLTISGVDLTSNRLITLYQRISDQMHLKPAVHGQGRQPVKLVYLHTHNECVLGWVSAGRLSLLRTLKPRK